MPWIDDSMHVTFGPGASNMSPEQIEASIAEIREKGRVMMEQRQQAERALEGLPYAAVPLDQLASIFKRFLRLTALGSLPLSQWDGMPETEVQVRRAIFAQSDFGAVYAGQWLPKELRQQIRDLVKGKRYDHNFDQHEVAYHRARMDGMIGDLGQSQPDHFKP
jgi:hypothetical protein